LIVSEVNFATSSTFFCANAEAVNASMAAENKIFFHGNFYVCLLIVF